MSLIEGLAKLALSNRIADEVDAMVEKEVEAKHPAFEEESLREFWRELGGSFHGASPDFYGHIPLANLLGLLRKITATSKMLLDERVNRKGNGLDISLCDNCDGLHVSIMNNDEIKAGTTIRSPEDVTEIIKHFEKCRDEMLQRQAKGATKQ